MGSTDSSLYFGPTNKFFCSIQGNMWAYFGEMWLMQLIVDYDRHETKYCNNWRSENVRRLGSRGIFRTHSLRLLQAIGQLMTLIRQPQVLNIYTIIQPPRYHNLIQATTYTLCLARFQRSGKRNAPWGVTWHITERFLWEGFLKTQDVSANTEITQCIYYCSWKSPLMGNIDNDL